MDPITLGLLYGGYWLSKKLQGGQPPPQGPPKCVLCPRDAELVTNCCKTPLCPSCMSAWKRDPNPCPCHRQG
jgi:hypothetical protein